MSPRLLSRAVLICFTLIASGIPLLAQSDAEIQQKLEAIAWKKSRIDMNGIASITAPSGYMMATGKDVATMMELNQNPVSGREVGFVAPESFEWFAVFEFDEIGYVKDDEREALDGDALLAALRKGTAEANEARKRRGWAPIDVVGWETPPQYNPQTQNLEWATRLRSEGEYIVNHNTRLLGRRGVMEVSLVCDPEQLAYVLPQFRNVLSGYSFHRGEKYAEFSQGDKIAAVGLAALVTGGAAAAASKTGLLKSLWKMIVAGVAAIGAFISRLFKRKKKTVAPYPGERPFRPTS